MGKLKVLTISLALIFLNRPVCAQDMEAQEVTPPDSEEGEHKPLTNDQAFSMGQMTPKSLTFMADGALRAGNVDKAIHLLKEALSMDNDDIEAHSLYAEALERKLRKQDEKDPELFNKCVREWLLVMKDEVGEEKGIGFKGISPPGLAQFYRDEDHNIRAKNHLIKLCGSAPKVWETNTRYLKRVLEKPHAEVAGKVVKAKDTNVKKDQYSYEEEPVTKSTVGQKKRDAKVVQQRETDINMEK